MASGCEHTEEAHRLQRGDDIGRNPTCGLELGDARSELRGEVLNIGEDSFGCVLHAGEARKPAFPIYFNIADQITAETCNQ
jgi:hypothetical protein